MEVVAAAVLVGAAVLGVLGHRYGRRRVDRMAEDLERLLGQRVTVGASKLVTRAGRSLYKVAGTLERVEGRGSGRRVLLRDPTVDPVGFAPDQTHVARHGIALADMDWVEPPDGERRHYTRFRSDRGAR